MSYNNNPSSSSYQTGQTSRQPNLDGEEYVPNLSSYETGPAKKTAGPHQSDLLNKLDPRVDSDLNDRAQYAPGTTTTTNVHPGATTHVSNPDASNLGPHSSSLKNKLDPRVNSKTGEMTTKTTNGEGSGPLREPVNTGYNNQSTTGGTTTGATGSRGDVVGGSSTGAPAVPTGTSATDYSREQGSYNPASGTGYTPTHQPHSTGTTAGTTSTTATTQPAGSTTTTSGSKGSSIKGAIAGIHGLGESLRGSVNAAVDRTFDEPEGVAKNEAINREGEYESQSGNFHPSTKQREGFSAAHRTDRV